MNKQTELEEHQLKLEAVLTKIKRLKTMMVSASGEAII